ncbi:MAG: YCF48-related protein [Jejuia sp.]
MRGLEIVMLFWLSALYSQATWQPVPNIAPNINNQRFDDIYFLNENLGWAANGFYARVYKTTDGGLTWNKQLDEADLTGDHYFRNIEFLNENIGFVGTLSSAFFKTVDGGNTWNTVNNISPTPNAICGLDAVGTSTVYGCGAFFEPAHIIKSTDSGDTWQYIDMSAYANALVEIKFLTENIGFVGGRSDTGAVVLKTIDGGENWEEIYNSNIPGQYVWKLQILDSNTDIIFGSIDTSSPNIGKLIKTSDGGENWSAYNAPESKIQAVGFINENVGWMGGHTTGFYQTNDGGQTWTNTNIGSNLNRIFVINPNLAYASGTTIYKFTEGVLNTNISIQDDYEGNPLDINIIKNPAKDKLEISINFLASDNVLINLYNIQGKLLHQLKRDIINEPTSKLYEFDIQHLPNGAYVLEIHNNLGRISRQFIKE